MNAPVSRRPAIAEHRPEQCGIDAASALKGRSTAWLVPNRFQTQHAEREDDGWSAPPALAVDALEDVPPDAAATPAPAATPTQVSEEQARRILTANSSPDIGFDLSISPYRGCEHGCIYCYARPTHSHLDLSPGLDFETRLVAKVNAVVRLRAELAAPGYRPALLNIGSVTDAYQPIEREWRLTRGVIEVLAACGHPFSLVTKSAGVLRDLDLLAPLGPLQQVAIYISLTSLDPALSRILEPRAASPARRLQTIRRLADAGVPVAVSVSPMIPFINEPELERLVAAAADAGAQAAFCVVLRLPWEVSPLFRQWLDAHFPERAERVMARVQGMRGGRDNDARFGSRMRGEGVWADLLRQRLHKACARHGLSRERLPLDFSHFVPPRLAVPESPQGSLF